MRPTVVVTVYPLLITVKSKPGYSGAPEKNRTPDILITNQALYQLSYKGNTLFTLQYTVQEIWYAMTGSNRRQPACKAGTLPTELIAHNTI